MTAAALAERGHEVVVLAGMSSGMDHNEPFPYGSITKIHDREIVHPLLYKRLVDSIELLQCDVLINYLSFMLLPKFMRIEHRLNIPIVHRVILSNIQIGDAKHALSDLFIKYPLSYGKIDFYDIARLTYPASMLRKVAKDSMLIPTSTKSQAWFKSAGFENVAVIPPAVDSVWFDSQRKTNKNKLTKLMYFGGGPSLFRGLDTLIKALNILKNHHDLFLDIWLRSPEARDASFLLRLIRKLGLSSRVRLLLGYQDLRRLRDAVSESSCMVFPFRLMAMIADVPLTILESMAMGKPIVSTPIGSIPETIIHGKTGLLVQPSNPVELSQAIQNIVQNESLRKNLALNARKSAKQYRTNIIMKKLVGLYESV